MPNTAYPLIHRSKSHPGSAGICYNQSIGYVLHVCSNFSSSPLSSKTSWKSCPKQPWKGGTPHPPTPRSQEHALPPRGPSAPILLPPHYCFNQSRNWLFGNPGCSRLVTALSLFNWSLNLLPAMIMRTVSPGRLLTVNYPCRPQPIRHTKSANCSD